MSITITLTNHQAFGLAKEFAKAVIHRVRCQRQHLLGGANYFPSEFTQAWLAIHSIPPGLCRNDFIASIRYHFKELRRDSGMEIRGRDYVAAVRAAERREGHERLLADLQKEAA